MEVILIDIVEVHCKQCCLYDPGLLSEIAVCLKRWPFSAVSTFEFANLLRLALWMVMCNVIT